jgi:hypothetical protein
VDDGLLDALDAVGLGSLLDDGVVVALGDSEGEGLGSVGDSDGADDSVSDGVALGSLGDSDGSVGDSLGDADPSVAPSVGLSLGSGEAEESVSPTVPWSASIRARIWSSNSDSRAWMVSRGTWPMSAPKAITSAHSASSSAIASSLSGPSSVTNSWTASE